MTITASIYIVVFTSAALSINLVFLSHTHAHAVTWVMLVLNVFVSIVGAAVANDNDRNQYLTTMGVSILYLVLFVPGTLFCWFLPVYHAYRYIHMHTHTFCVYILPA